MSSKLQQHFQLLSDPLILFCDEPTTSLDSFSAISLVKVLESIAVSGKIVFLTVHQPSSQLFEMFDNIILLAANGKVVFQGSKDNAKRFFERYLYMSILNRKLIFFIMLVASLCSVLQPIIQPNFI